MVFQNARQTKKIVLVPGVGFHKNLSKYEEFLERFQEKFGCETEIFNWSNEWNLPRSKALSFRDIRSLVCEVILDFQYVVRHCSEVELPRADCYIGHSAGSILALMQKDIPCITLGSPAALIENIKVQHSDIYARMVKSQRPVLNIIHTADVIACPLKLDDVENYYYKPFLTTPISLLTAHLSYWDNKKVINKMISTIEGWGIFKQ